MPLALRLSKGLGVIPMMPFMGVSNSWPVLARNMCLAWLAASAASRDSASSAVREKTRSSWWWRGCSS